MAPFPWAALAIFGSALLPYLLGKGGRGDGAATGDQTTTQVTETETEPRGWQSTIPAMMEMPLLQTFLGRYGMLQGAGMPGGKGYESPWMKELMNLISEQMPELMAGLRGPEPGRRAITGNRVLGGLYG